MRSAKAVLKNRKSIGLLGFVALLVLSLASGNSLRAQEAAKVYPQAHDSKAWYTIEELKLEELEKAGKAFKDVFVEPTPANPETAPASPEEQEKSRTERLSKFISDHTNQDKTEKRNDFMGIISGIVDRVQGWLETPANKEADSQKTAEFFKTISSEFAKIQDEKVFGYHYDAKKSEWVSNKAAFETLMLVIEQALKNDIEFKKLKGLTRSEIARLIINNPALMAAFGLREVPVQVAANEPPAASPSPSPSPAPETPVTPEPPVTTERGYWACVPTPGTNEAASTIWDTLKDVMASFKDDHKDNIADLANAIRQNRRNRDHGQMASATPASSSSSNPTPAPSRDEEDSAPITRDGMAPPQNEQIDPALFATTDIPTVNTADFQELRPLTNDPTAMLSGLRKNVNEATALKNDLQDVLSDQSLKPGAIQLGSGPYAAYQAFRARGDIADAKGQATQAQQLYQKRADQAQADVEAAEAELQKSPSYFLVKKASDSVKHLENLLAFGQSQMQTVSRAATQYRTDQGKAQVQQGNQSVWGTWVQQVQQRLALANSEKAKAEERFEKEVKPGALKSLKEAKQLASDLSTAAQSFAQQVRDAKKLEREFDAQTSAQLMAMSQNNGRGNGVQTVGSVLGGNGGQIQTSSSRRRPNPNVGLAAGQGPMNGVRRGPIGPFADNIS